MRARKKKPFMLHYNFPPFSVGETGRMTGTGRREDRPRCACAERAIAAVLPSAEESPYTIRIVSDILESNGFFVHGFGLRASLALYDSGIALKWLVLPHRDGPGEGRRGIRHPDRYCRRGRSLRRYGLQGGRYPQGHHALQMDIQDRRLDARRFFSRPWSRRSAAGFSSSTRWTLCWT